MERAISTPVVAADAPAVTEVVAALESSLYGQTAFSQADLEGEWSEIGLERDARVVSDGDRIVGYGVVRERGEVWRVEGSVHPDALGRGIGRLVATGLEQDTARGGARRIQNGVLEGDSAARKLVESLGYGAVRVFRELRIELEAQPPAPEWPEGLRVVPFDPERDALEFHAAHQEAFADAWDFTPRDFESWSKGHLRSDALTRRSGASFAPRPRLPPGRSPRAKRMAVALSIRSSRVVRGASRAWARRSSATPSDASGSGVSTALGSASTRRATAARSASTSAPG
jgi:ribosomal protein S18 acetylase RimI-like enzyme